MKDASIDTARRAIFSRLRSAMPAEQVGPPNLDGYYAQSFTASTADRVAQFVERARGWQAEVIETTLADWPVALLSVLEVKGVKRLLAGRDTELSTSLASTVGAECLCWYDESLDRFKATLFAEMDAGITTTRGGIVETGSLILWPNGNEPRTLSLVPPLHIAVVHVDQLHDTLYSAILAQRWSEGLPTNALLVTGPSKTADIQRLLVYGAHGPKQLTILLIRSEEQA
ncbi:lactate utilization protein C [Steroidobacter flavus]|uniref:Lactate utilization protein C n=1 Tax=Steroidobacter flavus TaxID=1842136 RepID=A0ABV8SWV3_9GAMM